MLRTLARFKENSSLHILIPKAELSVLNDLFTQKILFIQPNFRMTFFCHCTNSLSSLHISIHPCTFRFIPAHFDSSLHISMHACTFRFISAHFDSSLHISIHACTFRIIPAHFDSHCTFCASLHVKTSPGTDNRRCHTKMTYSQYPDEQ